MMFLFRPWDVLRLYFICLLFSVSEGGTERNCTFHSKYCFFVEEVRTPISTIADLEKLCRMRPGAWPLEIYDAKIQQALDKYLTSLDSNYSLKNVFLNVERSGGGWQYVQDYDRSKIVDLKGIVHHEDAAFFDTFEDEIETGWINYFELPYVCSFKPSSSQCNRTGSLVTSDLCFTRHEGQLKWTQALNDCRSRNGYLALMKHHHKAQVRQWLESSPQELKQWWIGLAWRPLMWRKKGTMVTWWNFHPDSSFMLTPDEIHFQIKADDNRWKIQKDLSSSDIAICMTEKDHDVCSGRECQIETNRNIPVVQVVVVVVVVLLVVIVAVVVAIKLRHRRKKRLESAKRGERAEPFKTVPDPCPSPSRATYFEPNVYEKPYAAMDENQYEELKV